MTVETLWQTSVCADLAGILSAESAVRALWLGGSLSRGDADEWSDIDLVAVVAGASPGEAAQAVQTRLESVFDVVLRRNRGDDNVRLLNFVTADWQRFDVSLYTLEALSSSSLGGLRLLFDKDDLKLGLTAGEPPRTSVTPDEVRYVVTEFVRVLGLLPVVVGRSDLIGAVSGSGLLRELLIGLLRFAQPEQIIRGALNETRTVSRTAAAAITGLPALRAEQTSIREFNHACWRVFAEFAPGICEQHGVPWPSALIESLRTRLTRDLDLTLA